MTTKTQTPHYALSEMIAAITKDAISDVPAERRFSGAMHVVVVLLADGRYRCAVTDRDGHRATTYVNPSSAQKRAPASAGSFDAAARVGLRAVLSERESDGAPKLRDDRERVSGRVVVRRTAPKASPR